MSAPRRLRPILTLLGLAIPIYFLLGPTGPGVAPASAEPWFHIKVVQTGHDAETVRVNVPLSLVEAMMPLMDLAGNDRDSDHRDGDRRDNDVRDKGASDVEDEHDADGASWRHHHGIRFHRHDLTPAEMRALLEAFRKAEDGEYVTVDGADERVRVSKSGGEFIIDVDDRGEGREQVRVRMPAQVLDALLSGEKDELNFRAAAKALQDQSGRDLVTVTSEDETVRIWIDDQKTAD